MSNGNPSPRFFSGATAEQPLASAVPLGTAFFDTTLLEYSVVGLVGGAHVWQPLLTQNSLGKYYVSPSATIPPFGLYRTINAAIAAAVADGHNSSNPADIWLLPGVYNAEPGNSVVMKDGINVRGFLVTANPLGIGFFDTVVLANFTLDAGFVTALIEGVEIQNVGAFDTITTGAPVGFSVLNIFRSVIRANGAGRVAINMAPAGTASVQLANTQIVNLTTQAGVAGVSIGGAGTPNLNMQDVIFSLNVQTDTAISTSVAATVNAKRVVIGGVLANVAGAAQWNLTDTDHTVTGSTSYINVTAGAPQFMYIRGSRTGSTAVTPYTGTFTLKDTDHQGDANSETFLSTITSGISQRTPKRYTAAASPGASVTAAQFQAAGDMVLVDTSGGVGAVALPARNLVPGGLRKYIFCSHGGANATTVTPNGTDTINGVNAAVVGAATLKAGFILTADPVTANNWLIMTGT